MELIPNFQFGQFSVRTSFVPAPPLLLIRRHKSVLRSLQTIVHGCSVPRRTGSSMPAPAENRRVQIVIPEATKCSTPATDHIRTRSTTPAYQVERITRSQGEMENEGTKVSKNYNNVESSYAEVTGAGNPHRQRNPKGGGGGSSRQFRAGDPHPDK
jgi:hypothetical protein